MAIQGILIHCNFTESIYRDALAYLQMHKWIYDNGWVNRICVSSKTGDLLLGVFIVFGDFTW